MEHFGIAFISLLLEDESRTHINGETVCLSRGVISFQGSYIFTKIPMLLAKHLFFVLTNFFYLSKQTARKCGNISVAKEQVYMPSVPNLYSSGLITAQIDTILHQDFNKFSLLNKGTRSSRYYAFIILSAYLNELFLPWKRAVAHCK